MHDIFLSYTNADLPRVVPLVQALEGHGWSVWWDRDRMLLGRAVAQSVETALEATKCVIVVWSSQSVTADWIRAEANAGRQRGILVPVLLDIEARLPAGFRRVPMARLHDWPGTEPHPGLRRLVKAVSALLGPPRWKKPHPPVGEHLVALPEPAAEPARYVNSYGMEFVRLPAGAFRMGADDGRSNEQPTHCVQLSRPFYLGIYAVTQGEWQRIMGTNPSRFEGDLQRPVERVSWDDAQKFLQKLNAQERGTAYRLPTEAEWEYAARAGSTTAYSFGDNPTPLAQYAWYDDNAGSTTRPIGQQQPNAWGLYDMHGNVWEWVQDWYAPYLAPTAVDPQGPIGGAFRVIRGGSWFDIARDCRSASRDYAGPSARDGTLGLRLLRMTR